MRQRTLILSAALEVYALVLVHVQSLGGVRTDEAKYLLNIPYPHPPLIRTLMNLTEWEMVWRVLLATLLVQAAWLVWDMGRDLSEEKRVALTGAWLLSTGLILQAGSVMLAPVTALFALLFLWIARRPDMVERYAGLVALLWLASLFSTFQAILFAPLVWTALRRGRVPLKATMLFVFVPIALLVLYTMTNPLAIATMFIHSSEGARVSGAADYLTRLQGLFQLWLMGGSVMIGLVGTWGILTSRSASLISSFVLVVLYCGLSNPFPFYAILFTPLFLAGVHHVLEQSKKWETFPLLITFAAGAVVVTFLFKPSVTPGPAREVMQAIQAEEKKNPSSETQKSILIAGSFGHDWQYESRSPILHYAPQFLPQAKAVICLSACEGMDDRGWRRLAGVEEVVWVRR